LIIDHTHYNRPIGNNLSRLVVVAETAKCKIPLLLPNFHFRILSQSRTSGLSREERGLKLAHRSPTSRVTRTPLFM